MIGNWKYTFCVCLLAVFLANGYRLPPIQARSSISRRGVVSFQENRGLELHRKLKMANTSESAKDGIEPKYIVALLVFIGACIYDKIVMHGGF